MLNVSWGVWKSVIWYKKKHISYTKSLFCATKLTKVESVCLETHNDPVSRFSHHFLFKMVLYYHRQWWLARTWPLLPLLMTYSNWRTMVGGDLAFGPLIWFNQGSMAFINEYHIGEMHFLVLSRPFQCFRLVPLVKRWLCLGFLDRSYFLQHFATFRQR